MIGRHLATPVVIHHVNGEGTDAEGNPVPTVEHVSTVCAHQPAAAGTEQVAGALATEGSWRTWFPIDTVITAADTYSVSGFPGDFTVEGDPVQWRPPRGGRNAHLEVRGKRRTG